MEMAAQNPACAGVKSYSMATKECKLYMLCVLKVFQH
jgi:hypothetical protein